MSSSPDSAQPLDPLIHQYPNREAVALALISLCAQLDLPKGTEHFISDIHGQYEGFLRVVSHASGAIKRKIAETFGERLSEDEQTRLGALIYEPEKMLGVLMPPADHRAQWYRRMVMQLIALLRVVAAKYPRAKVRRRIQGRFADLLDELLYEQEQLEDKIAYYQGLIEATIACDNAKALIVALSKAIQILAIDHLHVVGDIYDRGPGAHLILDHLMTYHSVDIQWGNHDILWMGAAAGSDACIANVIRICLRYGQMETLESGYAISLLPLISLAIDAYGDDPCPRFRLQGEEASRRPATEVLLMARMHKAITMIQFKLEAQIIGRCPEYGMDDRCLLDKIDRVRGTVATSAGEFTLQETLFPTVAAEHPYELSEAEQRVMTRLRQAFQASAALQAHARFLFKKGGIFKISNGNLLFHGCIPMNDDGSCKTMTIAGENCAGRRLMERLEQLARQGYFARDDANARQAGLDAMWYLWCGPCSPLFGKEKMATFERYFVDDKDAQREPRNIYYQLRDSEAVVRRILATFGLDPDSGHIVNGHVPVIVKRNENPVKAGGKLIVIDGGFSPAVQQKTGIAGYTLVHNSWGLLLSTHHCRAADGDAVPRLGDIDCTTEILERGTRRVSIRDTDLGRRLTLQIHALQVLLKAYDRGEVTTDLSPWEG